MNIYEKCPVYTENAVSLVQTNENDADDLLKCYSDKTAVQLFNSDKCDDDFHYKTIERMQEAIAFWDFAYQNKSFVRWSIVLNTAQERIGTVEMFHRRADDAFDHYGVLRIDLRSDCETEEIISAVLRIAAEHFYDDFGVEKMITKAVPLACMRIKALTANDWKPLGEKFMIYDDYFVR